MILATCEASSQKMNRASELPATHSHSSGELVGYIGTTTPPALVMPKLAYVQSGRVVQRTATRSPASSPRSISPRAISETITPTSR